MRVNSHRAKIKPAAVKWPRPCHGPNAISVLNGGCDLLAVGRWTRAADFSHWESNENHWAYYDLGCYQWFYTAARQGSGVFSFSLYSSWECDSLKWWINQTFWWLVFFSEYKAPGQVLFDYSVVMRGLDGCGGCIVINCTPCMLIMGEKGEETRDLSSRHLSKSKISFEMRETLKLSEVGDQRCHCDRKSFSRR